MTIDLKKYPLVQKAVASYDATAQNYLGGPLGDDYYASLSEVIAVIEAGGAANDNDSQNLILAAMFFTTLVPQDIDDFAAEYNPEIQAVVDAIQAGKEEENPIIAKAIALLENADAEEPSAAPVKKTTPPALG